MRSPAHPVVDAGSDLPEPASTQLPAGREATTVASHAPRDLNLDGLTKSFGPMVAVDAIDLDVRAGQVLALLGPSGCGKTTTLNMIAGFLDPDAGDIRVGGRSVVDMPPHRRNIGIVFQSYAIFPHINVADNVAFGLRWRRVSRKTRRRKASEQLERVGLGGMGDRFPSQLSGGQRQRVALARALIIEPELLLLDEPLSNLDAQLRSEMRSEIRSLVERSGVTTIIVTHDQEEALSMSDRVAVMRAGRVEQLGTPEQLFDQPASQFVAEFVGRSVRLDGQVVDVTASSVVVRLADGQLVSGQQAGAEIVHLGDPACVIVRPGAIHIDPASDEAMGVLATLERSAMVGEELELRFAAPTPLVLRGPRGSGLLAGMSYRLSWNAQDAHVFRCDT